ncbi:hypothetical protein QN379_00235 [Glaciimonas sp. Gout2]|uniref:DUF7946 domain-containing protein n=1 Tax=Glaciimonas sp. Gout2 TaxID=3048625 RepID=UPI002B23B0EA|nr:hypothetical protein [Glaciimonas sp. Gout2]MEB0080446.1 hypothetical protein [Glaciimonas sp. Gout2]
MSNKDIKLTLRVEGGLADEGVLDIYDAANTIYGLARSVNMVTHSFANNGEIRKKNKTATGSKTVIQSSIKGCFEEQIAIQFDDRVINRVGSSVIANAFWDYLTWVWTGAVGGEWEPTTPYVRSFAKNHDVHIDEISDALEAPMQLMHKSINSDENVRIFIGRPRVSDVMELNKSTLNYVTTRDELTITEYLVGNVTRFSVLSNFGRVFSDDEGRIISFGLIKDIDRRVVDLAIKSMQEHKKENKGKMMLTVTKVMSAHGVVKRYWVHDINEII